MTRTMLIYWRTDWDVLAGDEGENGGNRDFAAPKAVTLRTSRHGTFSYSRNAGNCRELRQH